ncbi:MAG: rod shape-determining protein RodA [Proteobacteria bacterium]|nr:rod shape-determining protein RodA [Pseudomonadota bacterium]MDE3208057.1 rod shape-determining protein RodA [Pseudomonadota bacterium]
MNVIYKLFVRFFRHMDAYLLLLVFSLLGIGLVILYSASDQSIGRVLYQVVNILVAFVVMWVFSLIPPQQLSRFALPIYILGLVLLIAVAIHGEVRLGARRWLNLGVTSIQPSEFMKIAVPMMLAWYLDKHQEALRLRDFAVASLFLIVPVIFILKQPDLGTALIILASGFFVLFLAGLGWRVIGGIFLAIAALSPVIWHHMHDYQRQRILTLLHPAQYRLGAGYHIIQSTIAMGSGGMFGQGWLHGTQAKLNFLPERSTDFIFAVFSEEFGFAGIMVLVLLFALLIARCMVISMNAPTLFTRLLSGSLTLTFFTYAFVNMAMVSGILPVVGIPLPLISYGGTSIVTLLLGFGILMSINLHRKLVQT